MSLESALAVVQGEVGEETHVSEWMTITQEMVNAFAEATRDPQWIHVDVEKAKAESPFGQTVAHGYFALSLLPYLTGVVDEASPRFPGVKLTVNYGLNRVRFPNPFLVGCRIRARTKLDSVTEVKGNALHLVNVITVEIEGAPKPGCVAETVSRIYF
jgi:acyl dehydratase